MKTRTIVEYLVAAIIVMILGGLAGWYFFLRTQTETTIAQNIARGFGIAIPEGNPNGSISNASPNTETSATPAQPVQRPAQLWRVEARPTAGQLFIGSGKNLRLRYVERASGYVLEANPETGQIIRLTNTLMPKIYEALLSENGHVFERSLDTAGNISTFAGTISTSTDESGTSSSTKALVGLSLPKNILSVSANPLSGALLYVTRDSAGSVAASAEWNGEKQKVLFASTLVSWRPSILEDGRTFLVQAAADGVPGYGYELKSTGALNLLLGPIPGLVVRIRSSSTTTPENALLWSQSSRGELRLFSRVGEDTTAMQIPVRTIADKCAWVPDPVRGATKGVNASGSEASNGARKDLVAYCGVPQGSTGQNFIDNWYRGATHSSDALWRIDASAGTAELIYTPSSNTPVDIENIAVDRGGNYITFMNAADKSLWLLRLKQ